MKTPTKQKRRVIRFYDRGAPFFAFTNFSPHPILVGGLLWPTSEHYFQAMKHADTWLEGWIRLEASEPRDAFRVARAFPYRADWDSVKLKVMHRAVLAKFSQHADLRRLLLGTGAAMLVEHTANDCYWGDGGNGCGLNMLGKTLMVVRKELR